MKKIPISLCVVSILILAGCKMPTSGLFYTLENEAIINNASNGLPADALTGAKDCRTDKLVILGSNYLVIAGSTLFVTDVPGNNAFGVAEPVSAKWKAIASPDSTTPACTDLAANGSNLYALFTSNANYVDGITPIASKDVALYIGTGSPASPSWKLITRSGETPQQLFTTGSGTVLLQTAAYIPTGANNEIPATSPSYNLYVLSGETATKISGFGPNYRRATAVAGPDASVMVATGDKVYSGNLGGIPALAPTTQQPPAPAAAPLTVPAFSALAHAGGASYYLASQSGWISKTTDNGANWTTSAVIQQTATGVDTIQFTGLVFLATLKDRSGVADISNLLLAGSAGQGIWRVSIDPAVSTTRLLDVMARPSDLSTEILWGGDFSSANQSLASTRGFFAVPNSKVFVGTNNRGLWSFEYNSHSSTAPVKHGLFFTWE